MFHNLKAITSTEVGYVSTCESCDYESEAVGSAAEARHRHAAHAWVAEPYMTV